MCQIRNEKREKSGEATSVDEESPVVRGKPSDPKPPADLPPWGVMSGAQ